MQEYLGVKRSLKFKTSRKSLNTYIQNYIDSKKELQTTVLDYLSDQKESDNESYSILVQTINDQEITQKKADLLEFLHFLVNVSNNYHRNQSFFAKIEKIILFLKESIKKLISDEIIFNIFKSNKKILLFLFEEEIIVQSQTITNILTSKKYKKLNYTYYFYPEVEPFIKEKKIIKKIKESYFQSSFPRNNEKETPKNFGQYYFEDKDYFMEKRKIGENDEYICNLIRNDLVIDFIAHVNKTNVPLNSKISSSIYETNEFLITKNPTLIEYAAFFGSIQIFNYLYKNNVKLTPSLWIYAIHGNHPEIIHFLEENKIYPNEYKDCFNEAIKCHHNNIADYIKNNYLEDDDIDEEDIDDDIDEEDIDDDIDEEDKEDENIDDENIDDGEFELKDEEENGINNNDRILFDAISSFSNPFIKYFNYYYFNSKMLNYSTIYNICKYDYPSFFSIIINNLQIMNNNNELLNISIKKKSNDIAKLLLENQKIDINKKSQIFKKKILDSDKSNIEYFDSLFVLEKEEKTPLFYAAENENMEIFKLLLSYPNIDINKVSNLRKWNRFGKKEEIEKYFDFNTIYWWVNQIYDDESDEGVEDRKEKVIKNTVLTISIEKNNVEMVRILLLHKGIDINFKTTKKIWIFQNCEGRRYGREDCLIEEMFPLKLAVINENIEIINLLLSHPEININEKSLLKTVYVSTDYHVEKIMTISEIEQNLLSIAIEYDNLHTFNILISQPKQNYALKVNKRKREIVYDDGECYQIHNWIIEKKFKNVGSLKKDDINKNLKQKDLIFVALHKGNLEIFKILATNPKVDLSLKDSKNKTLLHIAVENQYPNIVKFLLSTNKIDVNAETSEKTKKTAFHIAVEKGNLEIIKHLLSTNKIDINAKTSGDVQKTPLHIAIGEDLEVFKFLLDQSDIDVNADYISNNFKARAIHLAGHGSTIKFFELLLKHPKIDLNAKCFNGSRIKNKERNLLQIAVDNNDPEVIRILLSQPKFIIGIAELNELIRDNSLEMQKRINEDRKYGYKSTYHPVENYKEIDKLLREKLSLLNSRNIKPNEI